jgi:hypothetical protein
MLTTHEFALLERTALFAEADKDALRESIPYLVPRAEEILDVWYGFVGSHPHLLAYFSHPVSAVPNHDYLAKVRVRFADWIRKTAACCCK